MCAATAASDDPTSGVAVELISSRRNPLVGRLRQLQDSRQRRESGCLLLEGTHLLQEALALELVPELLLATPAWVRRHGTLLASLPATTSVRQAEPTVLEAAASTRSPDGVLAVLPTPCPQPPAGGGLFLLALDRIQDPGNLGTLLRTALAGGIEEVWLAEGADPHQPKALRASSGAALALPIERMGSGDLAGRLEAVRRRGVRVVAAVLPGPAWPDPRPYWCHDWRQPTLLLLGNEGAGIDPALRPHLDTLLTIPHSPAVESLNVAVAAAPLLLERWRQTSGAGPGSAGAGRDRTDRDGPAGG
jgi:TrmH family RNA methyltransferase